VDNVPDPAIKEPTDAVVRRGDQGAAAAV